MQTGSTRDSDTHRAAVEEAIKGVAGIDTAALEEVLLVATNGADWVFITSNHTRVAVCVARARLARDHVPVASTASGAGRNSLTLPIS